MNYQQRFHTEVKESTPYTRPLRSGKAVPGSMNEQDLFKSNKRPPMFRYLAIKVHEAKLLVDVSIFGKMTTYTKLQIGSTTLWKSSIDKESHMNPKWNEAKTFEIRTLCKYNKNFEKIFTASHFPDLSQHRLPASMNHLDKENDPAVIFGVYNNSLLRDSLIGEARVSLADILKAKVCSNWYMIHSGKEIVGSIHLAFKLEYNQEDLNTNFTQGDLIPSMKNFSPFEHRVHSEVYHRVNTEHLESHRSPLPTKMNIYDNRNHRSNVSAPRGQAFSQSYRNQTPSGYKTSADFDHANRMRPDLRVKTMGDHEMGGGFKIHKKPSGGGFQREYETLVTYENNYEEDEENVNEDGESSTPMDERQFYENFFNTRSSEERKSDIEKEDSDMTDCDLDSDEADEGDRVVKGEEFDEDDRPAEAMEVQKVLEAIKKNNKEVRDKEYELKGKFESIKVEFGKLMKEKEMFESKKNDLITREECLRNERGNLQADFNALKRQEEELRIHRGELSNLKVELVETKREEEIEKERTGQLEEQIREVSVYLQRETQSLKHLEHDMYKRLIAEKIQDYGVEFDETQTPRSTVYAENNNHIKGNVEYYDAGEEAHIREVLDKLMHTRLEMEQILTERFQNVGELKRYLENDVEEYGY